MADGGMWRVKLPIEVVVMILSELTHAEAWRLRILSPAVNDWVHKVLVARALQSTSLVARAPGSFIFYEPPGGVHGLRFSFLQKHGMWAMFQAKPSDKREIEDFQRKHMLHIVIHVGNNHDPLIVRHLKIRDLTLDRNSLTFQCSWRALFVAVFSMNRQQRGNQALPINPTHIWQPGKTDGQPGKWRKGGVWLYSDSQASTASGQSTSTSGSQHLYGLVQYDSGSRSSQSQQTQASSYLSSSGQVTTNSSGFSQLSHISHVPQSSPPRHLIDITAGSSAVLHSLMVYQESSGSGSSDPSAVEAMLQLSPLNPAPPLIEPQRDRLTPAPVDTAYVASSPMSDSNAFSATIRPIFRGGESSPLPEVAEEEEWMDKSEFLVSQMVDLASEDELELEDAAESQGTGTGTTLAESVGPLSRMGSGWTETTDVEYAPAPGSMEKKYGVLETRLSNDATRVVGSLGGAVSLPLEARPVVADDGRKRGITLSPPVARRTRSTGAKLVSNRSVTQPPSDTEA